MMTAIETTGEQQATALATPAPQDSGGIGDIMSLMERAIDKGIDADTIAKLIDLKNQQEDRASVREFNRAMAQFQNSAPKIKKTSKAAIKTNSGGSYGYSYAELEEIENTIRPAREACGLSYSWDEKTEGEMVTTVCTIRHEAGHSITSSFTCPKDARAAMNEQQKCAGAYTYGRRQTLIGGLGLTTADEDTDANYPQGGGESFETITLKQGEEIGNLINEVGADKDRFFKHFGIAFLTDLTESQHAEAKAMLNAKRGG